MSGTSPANRWASLLAYGTAAPALLVLAWLLAALPLLLVGYFRPLPALVIFAVVIAVGLRAGALRALQERASAWGATVPPWVVVAVAAVAVAFTIVSLLTSADGVIIRRDPQTYSVIADWLAAHGRLDIPAHAAAFGGPDRGLQFATQGFYPGGGHVVPQFMSGLPALLAVGGWLGGLPGVLHANAIIGGLAILVFAGLVARLVGPRWAPLGALALALTGPELHAARSAFSEPAAQLLIVGGLAVLADATLLERRPAVVRAPAMIAGLALGAVTVVRIDALSQLVPLIPFVALLAFQRSPLARPFAVGMVAGVAAGFLDGLVLSRPYVASLSDEVLTAVGGGLLLMAACPLLLRQVRRMRERGSWPPAWLRPIATGGVVACGLAFALRPWLETARTNPASGGAEVVAVAQEQLGLDVDGSRTYYEDSLRWVAWYVGWPALVAALAAATWLVWRLTKGPGERSYRLGWAAAVLVLLGAAALVLWRPGITPDHPWADRRLVPAVLPAVVLLAVVGGAFAVRRLGRSRLLAGVLGAGVLAVLVAPTALASAPLIGGRTEQGEVALVRQVCARLRPGDVVLTVGDRARAEWTGTLRVMCGVPTAQVLNGQVSKTVARVTTAARAAGSNVVLMAADPGDLMLVDVNWGAPVAQLRTHEDERTLITRPSRLATLGFEVWLVRNPSPANS